MLWLYIKAINIGIMVALVSMQNDKHQKKCRSGCDIEFPDTRNESLYSFAIQNFGWYSVVDLTDQKLAITIH